MNASRGLVSLAREDAVFWAAAAMIGLSCAAIASHALAAGALVALGLSFLLLRHLDWIPLAVVIVSFTRADAWATSATGIPCGTVVFVAVTCSITLMAVATRHPLRSPNSPVALLASFYASCLAVGILTGRTEHAGDWIRDAAYAFLSFAAIYTLSTDAARLRRLFAAVAAVSLLVALVNIAELLAPGWIQLSNSQGRAAGLLKNANISAFATAAGFMCLQFVTVAQPHRWTGPRRLGLALARVALFCGTLATFSRGGLSLLAIGIVGSVIIERRTGRTTGLLLPTVALSILAAAALAKYLAGTSDVSVLFALKKLSGFLHGHVDDNYRFDLARHYLARFLDRPLTGYGFGATTFPSAANVDLNTFFGVKGPHNTPIAILAEFGAAPAIVYGLFYVFAFAKLARVRDAAIRSYGILLLLVVLFENIFAHDLHLSRPTMVLLALIAAAADCPPTAVEPTASRPLNESPQPNDPVVRKPGTIEPCRRLQ